eukprot:jgi/Mesen1/2402/ME000157S01546
MRQQGMIRLPDAAPAFPKQRTPGTPRLLHVASLQPLGGPLRTSLAAAGGPDVLVYDVTAASANPTAPSQLKARWQAHDGPITCLHRSTFACALFTGEPFRTSRDGTIRLWDLRSKPSAPLMQFSHHKAVTGALMLDTLTLVSAASDGHVAFWDMRTGGGGGGSAANSPPLRSVAPDGKPVFALAASPSRDALAVSTAKGIYCIELAAGMGARPTSGNSGADYYGGGNSGNAAGVAVISNANDDVKVGELLVSPLTPLPQMASNMGLVWNERTGDLYAYGGDGSISIYKRPQ